MSAARSATFRIAVRKFSPFEQAIRAQWAAFEAVANPGLELELVPLELGDLEAALLTSGGMMRGDWDLAFVNTDWIAPVHALGAATDLAPLLAQAPPPGFPEAWTPSLLRLQRLGAAVLGVPYHDGPECLVYRRDLFEDPQLRNRFEQQFGRPLLPPQTWPEFHATARFLHGARPGLSGTVFAAYPDGHNTVYDFLLQLWTRSGELFNEDGECNFETPQAVEALRFYRALLTDATAVHPRCLTLDSVAAGARFAAGEVAMMVNWFGFATHAHTSPDSAVRGMVDVAEIPAGSPGTTASLNVYWLLAIPSGTPHPELAGRFLLHTQTPEMDLLTSASGAIGCRRSTWSDPSLNAAMPFYHRLESLHRSAREIPQRTDWPRIAAVIDTLVTQTITTTQPIPQLLREAQAALQS